MLSSWRMNAFIYATAKKKCHHILWGTSMYYVITKGVGWSGAGMVGQKMTIFDYVQY
jgi:hypothetical protein